jgi:hypothetical protein
VGKARLKVGEAENGSFVTGWVFATIPVSEARPGDLLARLSPGRFFDGVFFDVFWETVFWK